MYKVYGIPNGDCETECIAIFTSFAKAKQFARECTANYHYISIERETETLAPTTKTIHKALW